MKAEVIISTHIDESCMEAGLKTLLKRTLSLILKSNFLCFNGTNYIQNTGAPMGSSLSGVLPEFILRPLENNIMGLHNNKFRIWIRYVDDIFLIWDNRYDFDNFVDEINGLDNDIKFTKEIETNNKLNFLDVSIIRKNDLLLRDVYRKPTSSGSIIPKNATAPWAYKMSAFRSMLHRMDIVCSRRYKNIELKRILTIARKNGYETHTIMNMYSKMRNNNN